MTDIRMKAARITRSFLYNHDRALGFYRTIRDQFTLLQERVREPALAKVMNEWMRHRNRYINQYTKVNTDLHYFELLRRHAGSDAPNRYMVMPLFSFPLLLHARRIVELGCAFSYYPKTYPGGSPWHVSKSDTEGLISTRILLSACRMLTKFGIDAKLTSVDVRQHEFFNNAERLFRDLALSQYWQPMMGTDSVAWLTEQLPLIQSGQEQKIDFALVDSNHTYEHVRAELEHLAPLMSDNGVIAVDNCYTIDYRVGGEGIDGLRRGSQFGAILDFMENHDEWVGEWGPWDMMFLYRRECIQNQVPAFLGVAVGKPVPHSG